jgi:hypothetical protein
MSKGRDVRSGAVAPRRATRHGLRRSLIVLMAVVATAMPGSLLIASQPAFGAGNANLVGRWTISGGYLGFTVKSENRATGACAGITASPQYHMIGCRVTGNRYVFTITLGTGYRSRNKGTIEGNKIIGSFSDSNGTVVQYTGVR